MLMACGLYNSLYMFSCHTSFVTRDTVVYVICYLCQLQRGVVTLQTSYHETTNVLFATRLANTRHMQLRILISTLVIMKVILFVVM